MPAITVRNLSEETKRALKARARANGRSTEAEVRAILSAAVADPAEVGIGSRIARLSAEVGGFNLDIERDQTSSEPVSFS